MEGVTDERWDTPVSLLPIDVWTFVREWSGTQTGVELEFEKSEVLTLLLPYKQYRQSCLIMLVGDSSLGNRKGKVYTLYSSLLP